MNKSYRELTMFTTYEERMKYLMMHSNVGEENFGYLRYMAQKFYKTNAWQHARKQVMIRDNGWDLGMYDYPISGKVFVHHINPITIEMLEEDSYLLYDPDNLICMSLYSHNLLHYGHEDDIPVFTERTPGDTRLW